MSNAHNHSKIAYTNDIQNGCCSPQGIVIKVFTMVRNGAFGSGFEYIEGGMLKTTVKIHPDFDSCRAPVFSSVGNGQLQQKQHLCSEDPLSGQR